MSTPGANYAEFDVGDFYLETPLDEYEYMKMPLDLFLQCTRDQYNLDKHAYKGFVYWEIRKAIYGLPQAGALANKQPREFETIWLLRDTSHTRTVETQNKTNLFLADYG